MSCAVYNSVLSVLLTRTSVFWPGPVKHVFGAHSLSAAIESILGAVNKRRQHFNVFRGLYSVAPTAKCLWNTLQHEIRLLLRLRLHLTQKNTIWHDVIDNSITPHSSNFNCPLSSDEIIAAHLLLLCEVSAIVYCQRNGLPRIYRPLPVSFLAIDNIAHFLSHLKQNDLHLIRQNKRLLFRHQLKD